MLVADIEWLGRLHEMVKDRETPMTESGRVLYYLDANGRYEERESLLQLLGYAEKVGY